MTIELVGKLYLGITRGRSVVLNLVPGICMYVLKIDLVSGKTVCDLGSGRTIEVGSSVGTCVTVVGLGRGVESTCCEDTKRHGALIVTRGDSPLHVCPGIIPESGGHSSLSHHLLPVPAVTDWKFTRILGELE